MMISIVSSGICFLEDLLRVSTPLILAAMGGLLLERSGLVGLGLEGTLLFSAFFAAIGAHYTQSVWYGAFFAVIGAIFFSLLLGFCILELAVNQIVACIAFNMLAAGFTPFLSRILFESSSSTPILPIALRFQTFPMFFALVFVGFSYWLLEYSFLGLWIKVSGENPAALKAAGISPKKIQYRALILYALACGMGGAALSLSLSSGFVRNMTAGKGFMALGSIIFGKWKPFPTLFACLFFGLSDDLQMRLQGLKIYGTQIPVQFIQMIPYVTILIALGIFVGKSTPPKYLGDV